MFHLHLLCVAKHFNFTFSYSIGYPVVTLGFGFKSYVGYRMRQRRQREVQKENEYYYQFLKEALPPGVREDAFNPHPSPKPCKLNETFKIKKTPLFSSLNDIKWKSFFSIVSVKSALLRHPAVLRWSKSNAFLSFNFQKKLIMWNLTQYISI